MGWKMFDYKCPECGHTFESMEKDAYDEVLCPKVVDGGDVSVDAPGRDDYEVCGARADYLPSANLGWSNDPSAKKEMLKKRSVEHTAKEQKVGNMMSPKDLPKL